MHPLQRGAYGQKIAAPLEKDRLPKMQSDNFDRRGGDKEIEKRLAAQTRRLLKHDTDTAYLNKGICLLNA